ncbi:unnamed protein product [Chironomus riparius]|uniref:RING-type domain-containing protein n=1 Tax=Chironomus riparius TaxID=315576 RepID=A0A9N9S268_9DIPT|nr:unnamed protein product [Chironomus riparius]
MDCVVCMSFVENDIYSTFCGHLFCKQCVDKMILNSTKCWTCQTALNKAQVHKVFLPSSGTLSRHAELSLINARMNKLLKNDEEILKRVKALEEAKKPEKGNVILILDD